MEKILAIVEGHAEVRFMEMTYGRVIVLRPFPNGVAVSIELIAEKIVDALEPMGAELKRVVVLLDRERRPMAGSELEVALKNALDQKCTGREIYVGVSDRQIENWILADEGFISQRFNNDYSYPGDGFSGKPILNSFNTGASYGPTDVAKLLKGISVKRATQKSQSLLSFVRQINFEWYWIQG